MTANAERPFALALRVPPSAAFETLRKRARAELEEPQDPSALTERWTPPFRPFSVTGDPDSLRVTRGGLVFQGKLEPTTSGGSRLVGRFGRTSLYGAARFAPLLVAAAVFYEVHQVGLAVTESAVAAVVFALFAQLAWVFFSARAAGEPAAIASWLGRALQAVVDAPPAQDHS